MSNPTPYPTFTDTPAYHLSIPCPPDRLDELLPAELVAAYREVQELKAKATAAGIAYGRAHQAIEEGAALDVTQTADALRAGKKDPGPVNHNRAAAEAVNARRLAEASARAAFDAATELHETLRRGAFDRDALQADFDARAKQAATAALEHLAAAKAAHDECLAMKNMARWAEVAPAYSGLSIDTLGPWPVVERQVRERVELILRGGKNRTFVDDPTAQQLDPIEAELEAIANGAGAK